LGCTIIASYGRILRLQAGIVTSSLIAASLDFPLPVWWTNIHSRSVGLLSPEDIGLAVEIAFQSCQQAEI